MQILLIVKGMDRAVISFKLEAKLLAEKSFVSFGGKEKQVTVKIKEIISPKTRPITAMAGEMVIPFVTYI